MRIFVSKPIDGKTTVRIEDRRGLTGYRETRVDVPLNQVGAVAEQLANKWHTRRNAIEDARKALYPD